MKIRRLVRVAILVSSAVLGCAGCSTGSEVASMTIGVSMDDVLERSAITRDVVLVVGDTLKVALGSNRGTAYRWSADPKIGDPTILQQTSHEYERPSSDRTGAPGTEVWMFTALKGGTTTIVADYASAAGSDTTPRSTFTAKVKVDPPPFYAHSRPGGGSRDTGRNVLLAAHSIGFLTGDSAQMHNVG